MAQAITLRNGPQTATFAPVEGGYRPEWMRLGARPMLRLKDHEWLNVGGLRVTVGELKSQTATSAEFGGTVLFAGTPVDWSVRVAVPADGKGGFTVTTHLEPREEDIEVLEAMTCFELPYEYDGSEHSMTVMAQQPVFRWEGDRAVSGAGYTHPFWYYGRPGRAHRTFCNSSPMLASRVAGADGSNERVVLFLGNWDKCAYHDLFAQPTRGLGAGADDVPIPDPELRAKPALRGMKYLVGAVNWNTSMHKDPNVLVAAGAGLAQEVTVDFAGSLPGGRWDALLADGWERLCRTHFPHSGRVPAFEVAQSLGASWTEAAAWLSDQFARPEGCPGFFFPERGPCVYAPHTRPKWDEGVPLFAGQFAGPVAYLAHLYKNDHWRKSSTATSPPRRAPRPSGRSGQRRSTPPSSRRPASSASATRPASG
jgi:hypothetical protein